MNRFLIFVLLFLIASCPIIVEATTPIKIISSAKQSTFDSFKISPGLKVIHILPSAYIIEDKDGPAPAYSMIVEISADSLLIVDSPYTARNTKIELKWIHEKFGKKKMTVINTHYHLDRVGGNEVWMQEKIPVYGSDLTASLLSDPKAASNKWKIKEDIVKYLSDPKLKESFKEMNITAPDHLFPINQGKVLFFDNKKVEIFYPGPAHSPDNVVVYIPHLKLLFGGCMIVAFPKIFLVEEADANAWPTSLSRLKRFQQVKWVIPGHPASLNDDLNFSPKLIQNTETLLKKKSFILFTKNESQKISDANN